MNASMNISPMCRRCGEPVDPDAGICPSCGSISSPTAIRKSAYSTMSGTTKGLIAIAFVCVLGLAGYTLTPGSMHSAPADTNASDVARAVEAERSRPREVVSDSRSDASTSAALDAVRESIQRHDMQSAKVLLAAILALHRDNPDALALRDEVKANERQDKVVTPASTDTPDTPVTPTRAADTRRTSAVMVATPRKQTGKQGAHGHAGRTSAKAAVVANTKVSKGKVTASKAGARKSAASKRAHVATREPRVKQRPKTSVVAQASKEGTPRAVQTASGAPPVSNIHQESSPGQGATPNSASKSERWRDRGGVR